MSAPAKPKVLDGRAAAIAHVELLTGACDSKVCVRLIHDANRSAVARKLEGTIDQLWPTIERAQAAGYGAFVVVNEGGHTDDEITRVRALFVDADNVELSSITWHVPPDFLTQRDEYHWHAYWRVFDLPVEQFRESQKRLAAYYKSDPAVCNLSRVMRIAGTLHQKVTVQ